MNALVKKEIRLLLPVWLAVLVLEVALPWTAENTEASAIAPVFFFFGMILLAVDSFGREFSLGTFSSLMSQPMERRHIWRTKITVLLLGAALIFAAYFVSCELRLNLTLAESHSTWRANEINVWRVSQITGFHTVMIVSVAVLFVALTGGLWTALLLRQIAAAFWITFLAPAGIAVATMYCLPDKYAVGNVVTPLLCSLAAIYAVTSYWLAHRLFHQAQDAGWTGGVISFSKWRYFESGSESSVSTRHRKPLVALIKKELQLQSISWFCAAALLALHLVVILMRAVHGTFQNDSIAGVTSEFFWAVWLVMPLIIGSTAVAEEQRLGVTDGQFCLPASRRLQFAMKFFLAIASSVLLGGFMPLLLEGIATAIGAPNPDFSSNRAAGFIAPVAIVAFALGLSLAAFYASTLTKNFLQAIGIAVIIIIGCFLFTNFVTFHNSFLLITWNSGLLVGISILTVLVAAPWLTYNNFKYVDERGRIWRRNVFCVAGTILFIFTSSSALYNRAWEAFEPAEPAHGPAKLSLVNPPTLRNEVSDMLMVRLPDGRIWFDSLGFTQPRSLNRIWLALVRPFPVSAGPHQFMAGSNWISATARRVDFELKGKEANPQGSNHVIGYFDTIGVRSDGTLWISEPNHGLWNGDNMSRFGDGTNWLQVVRGYAGVFLLKNDGTLWFWGTNRLDWSNWQQTWPSLRSYQFHRYGTDSDWKELRPGWNSQVRKSDGSVWSLGFIHQSLEAQLNRETNMDEVSFQTLSVANEDMAYVRKDGTLWVLWQYQRNGTNVSSGFVRAGTESNWIAVALTWNQMVALKSDGSLWQWNRDYNHSLTANVQKPPARLGIHNDWVAFATYWNDTVALAADGSLWLWPNLEGYESQPTLIKLPKQPQFLGNVFDKTN